MEDGGLKALILLYSLLEPISIARSVIYMLIILCKY